MNRCLSCRPDFGSLLVVSALLLPASLKAQVTRTWVGTSASMNVTNNWSPVGVPAATNGDNIVFSGSSAQNSPTFPYNVFNGNNGLGDITVTSAQITNLTINSTGGAGSDVFRLLGNKRVAVEPGAGAFSMGTSGSTFYLNLGNTGSGNVFVNDSASRATLGSRITINASGGSGGRAVFTGTGDWRVDGTLSAAVSRGLVKAGAGALTLAAQNLYLGGTSVSNGTLRIVQATALAGGAVAVESDGLLDLTLVPDGATVTNVITGAGKLRVRGGQAVVLDRLSPSALGLQVDVAGLSLGTYTVLKRAGTTFGAGTFATVELLNATGVTTAFDYGTVGELRLQVQALPDEVAWDGESPADGNWSTAVNWAGDTTPASWASWRETWTAARLWRTPVRPLQTMRGTTWLACASPTTRCASISTAPSTLRRPAPPAFAGMTARSGSAATRATSTPPWRAWACGISP